MSVPVVNACMLSALCAPELRRKVPDPEDVDFGEFAIKGKYDAEGGAVVAEKGDLQDRSGAAKDFMSVFSPIAESLAEEAYKCSVLCNSESSGQTSSSEKFFECADSGYRISSDGVDRHQTDSLNLVELHIGKRPDATAFGLKLRKAVPSMIRLGEGWEETVPEAKGLESYSFLLQRVSRGSGRSRRIKQAVAAGGQDTAAGQGSRARQQGMAAGHESRPRTLFNTHLRLRRVQPGGGELVQEEREAATTSGKRSAVSGRAV